MPTEAAPDGAGTGRTNGATGSGAPPPGSTANAGGNEGGDGSEPLRNVGELKKTIKQRDRYKEERDALQSKISKLENGDLLAENEALRLQINDFSQKFETLKTADAEKASKLEEQNRAGRRTAITDVILSRAHPEHRDDLRLMLSGLHEAKELDLYAEDTNTEGGKALEKLAKRYPKYFRAADGAPQGGTPGAPSRSYGNPQSWMDLTPEQRESMSQEDFNKLFGPGAGPGGVGPIVPRRR